MLLASVSGVSLPSLKNVAWLMPPIITAIASAVESPPDGDLSAILPSSVEPAEPATLHRAHQWGRDQRIAARPVRQQLRIVPAITDLIFVGARRALDDERRIAADPGGKMLRHP